MRDIAKYLQEHFKGRQMVPLNELWELLDDHPIFPSEGYRNDIKKELVATYGARQEQIYRVEINKKETVINFSK